MAFPTTRGGATTPIQRIAPAADEDDVAAQQILAGDAHSDAGSLQQDHANTGAGGGDDSDATNDTSEEFASAFEQATGDAGRVAQGKYEAIIVEMVLQKFDPKKGQSVRCKYTVCDPGDEQGKQVTQWYKVLDAAKGMAPGMDYLKKDLTMLGYENLRAQDVPAALKQINETRPGVLIQVKHNQQFTNVYLQGLCDDSQSIEEFKQFQQRTNPHNA